MKFAEPCAPFTTYLPPYVDGSLKLADPSAYERLVNHLTGCAECRAEVREAAQTHYRLRMFAERARQTEELSPSARPLMAARVLASLNSDQERRFGVRRTLVRYAAAAACAATLVLVALTPSPAREWITRTFLTNPAPLAQPEAPKPAPLRSAPLPQPRQDPFAAPIAPAVYVAVKEQEAHKAALLKKTHPAPTSAQTATSAAPLPVPTSIAPAATPAPIAAAPSAATPPTPAAATPAAPGNPPQNAVHQ
jgi:hypothetical protein